MARRLVDRASNVSDATIQKHIRAVLGFKEALESAQGDYRSALKAAKKDGINTGQMIRAMGEKKRELEDVQSDLKQFVRYLGLLNMPVVQMDLFDAAGPAAAGRDAAEAGDPDDADAGDEDAAQAEQEVWNANGAGQKAGADGLPISANPFKIPMLAEAWAQGWRKSQEALVPKGGVKKASTRRQRSATPLN